jgi:hypothetical protein
MCWASTDRIRASRNQPALQRFDPTSITCDKDFKTIEHAHQDLNVYASLNPYTNTGSLEPGKCG